MEQAFLAKYRARVCVVAIPFSGCCCLGGCYCCCLNGEGDNWPGGTSKNICRDTLDIGTFERFPIPRAWWKSGWIAALLVLISTLYRGMEMKLRVAESKIKQLTTLLQTRDEMLQSLVMEIDKLKEETEENERQLEFQRNELKEQYAVLQEMFVVLRAREEGILGKSAVMEANEFSKEFWILRKHRRSLVVVTKPYMDQIIAESVKAGLVSENIGQCGTNCQISGHDCSDGFYKALQVKVNETPHTLESFIILMQKLQLSNGCKKLCSTMLGELQAANK